jgi:hypothetical protein
MENLNFVISKLTKNQPWQFSNMGLSENSVPLHPMVNDHYPYSMAIIGGIPHFQTYPYVQ